MNQLTILNIQSPECPFMHRLDHGDNHCHGMGLEKPGYEVLAEDHPDFDEWLAVVRGVDFDNVTAVDIEVPDLSMVNYIPTIRRGDGNLFNSWQPRYVGIRLQDVVSPVKLQVPDSLDRFGLPKGTLPILQCYGSDRLIENLWPYRREVFSRLAKLGFIAATSVNYSIWDDQPHAERLINIKRGLITFEDWQSIGVSAIPHIYWYGYKDLDAWLDWLNANPTVNLVAINLQTIRPQGAWNSAMEQLGYFVHSLSRPIHFLINGPATLSRIQQLHDVLPSFTLSNAYATRMASAGQLLRIEDDTTTANYSDANRSDVFGTNNKLYERYLSSARIRRSRKVKTEELKIPVRSLAN